MCDLFNSWACSVRICCTYHLYLSPLWPLLILIFRSAKDDCKTHLWKLTSNAALQNDVFCPSGLEHPVSTEFQFSWKCKGLRFKIGFIYVSLYIVFMTTVIYLIESAMTKQLGGKHEGLNVSFGMS